MYLSPVSSSQDVDVPVGPAGPRGVAGPDLCIEERDPLGPTGAPSRETEAIWQAVEAQCADASPFVRWPWVGAWLEVYGKALAPRLLVARRAGGAAGVVLVAGRRLLRHKLFPVRQLHLNTAGEPGDGSVCVEYNQMLCPKAEQDSFSWAVLRHLGRERDWDELYLSGFAPERLPLAWPVGTFVAERRRPCHAMDLALLRSTGQNPEEALSANTRHQIRRSLRLFGGRERLLLEEARSVREAHEFLHEMIELHQASWQARGQSGVFGASGCGSLARFLELLIDAGHPGSIQLLRLRDAQGRTLGASCNLLGGGTVYFYQSGLRLVEDARQKPGLCLHLLAMEHNLAAGRDCYDFMASELRYKQSLSNMRRTLVWGAIQRPRLRLLVEKLAVQAVRGVRGLRAAGK